MTRRRILLGLFVAMLAGALVLYGFSFSKRDSVTSQAEAAPAVQLTVESVRPERVVLEAELSGRVAAYRRVEIRPQVSGLILERLVIEGTRVAAGDVLFRIDPAPLQAELAVAEAALVRAVTAEDHARRAVTVSDALLERNAVSKEKNDTAHNELLLATSGVAEARAVVARRRLDLDFAVLRAPIDGYVAAGVADIGGLATVGADKPLAVIQDLDKVYVDLRVPAEGVDALLFAAEQRLGPVQVKSSAEWVAGMSLADQDQIETLTGQLKFSDVIVDPGTGNASIRIEVANPYMALLPGMFVRATLPRGLVPEALMVPEDAILRKGDGSAQVVVVTDGGEAQRRSVKLGDRLGKRMIVETGLSAGEKVAIKGQDRVPDGNAIQVTIHAADAPAENTAPPVTQH